MSTFSEQQSSVYEAMAAEQTATASGSSTTASEQAQNTPSSGGGFAEGSQEWWAYEIAAREAEARGISAPEPTPASPMGGTGSGGGGIYVGGVYIPPKESAGGGMYVEKGEVFGGERLAAGMGAEGLRPLGSVAGRGGDISFVAYKQIQSVPSGPKTMNVRIGGYEGTVTKTYDPTTGKITLTSDTGKPISSWNSRAGTSETYTPPDPMVQSRQVEAQAFAIKAGFAAEKGYTPVILGEKLFSRPGYVRNLGESNTVFGALQEQQNYLEEISWFHNLKDSVPGMDIPYGPNPFEYRGDLALITKQGVRQVSPDRGQLGLIDPYYNTFAAKLPSPGGLESLDLGADITAWKPILQAVAGAGGVRGAYAKLESRSYLAGEPGGYKWSVPEQQAIYRGEVLSPLDPASVWRDISYGEIAQGGKPILETTRAGSRMEMERYAAAADRSIGGVPVNEAGLKAPFISAGKSGRGLDLALYPASAAEGTQVLGPEMFPTVPQFGADRAPPIDEAGLKAPFVSVSVSGKQTKNITGTPLPKVLITKETSEWFRGAGGSSIDYVTGLVGWTPIKDRMQTTDVRLLEFRTEKSKLELSATPEEYNKFLQKSFEKGILTKPTTSATFIENPELTYDYGEFTKWGVGAGNVVKGSLGFSQASLEQYGYNIEQKKGIGTIPEKIVYGTGYTFSTHPEKIISAYGGGAIMVAVGEIIGAGSGALGITSRLTAFGAAHPTAAAITSTAVRWGVPIGFGGLTYYGASEKFTATPERTTVNIGKMYPEFASMMYGGASTYIGVQYVRTYGLPGLFPTFIAGELPGGRRSTTPKDFFEGLKPEEAVPTREEIIKGSGGKPSGTNLPIEMQYNEGILPRPARFGNVIIGEPTPGAVKFAPPEPNIKPSRFSLDLSNAIEQTPQPRGIITDLSQSTGFIFEGTKGTPAPTTLPKFIEEAGLRYIRVDNPKTGLSTYEIDLPPVEMDWLPGVGAAKKPLPLPSEITITKADALAQGIRIEPIDIPQPKGISMPSGASQQMANPEILSATRGSGKAVSSIDTVIKQNIKFKAIEKTASTQMVEDILGRAKFQKEPVKIDTGKTGDILKTIFESEKRMTTTTKPKWKPTEGVDTGNIFGPTRADLALAMSKSTPSLKSGIKPVLKTTIFPKTVDTGNIFGPTRADFEAQYKFGLSGTNQGQLPGQKQPQVQGQKQPQVQGQKQPQVQSISNKPWVPPIQTPVIPVPGKPGKTVPNKPFVPFIEQKPKQVPDKPWVPQPPSKNKPLPELPFVPPPPPIIYIPPGGGSGTLSGYRGLESWVEHNPVAAMFRVREKKGGFKFRMPKFRFPRF